MEMMKTTPSTVSENSQQQHSDLNTAPMQRFAGYPHWLFDDTEYPDPHGRGERAVRFIRGLRHPKSQFKGRGFQLDLWQERLIRRIYGDTLVTVLSAALVARGNVS